MKVKEYFATGKLYIAGEYAVVYRKSAAILAPLELGILAVVKESENYFVTTSKYKDQMFLFTVEEDRVSQLELQFVKEAMDVAFLYLKELGIEPNPFHLDLKSTLDSGDNEKFGFGSSAAVTVATIGGILAFFEVTLSKEELYKLAVLSQVEAYPHSSYGDIASSVMNQWIYYKPFLLEVLNSRKEKTIVELIQSAWDGLVIRPFEVRDLHMMVIWTKKEANSALLVENVNRYQNYEAMHHFQKATEETVEKLFISFTNQENICIINDIQRLNILLKELSSFTKQNLFTSEMKEIEEILTQFTCGMKFSGAGAGDCLIAFFQDKKEAETASQLLMEKGYKTMKNIVRGVSNDTQR